MKKSQSGSLGPEFELGTSRIRVRCVTTPPPRSVALFLFRGIDQYYYHRVKHFAVSLLKEKISSLIWLMLSKLFNFTLIAIYFCSEFFGNLFQFGFRYWTFWI